MISHLHWTLLALIELCLGCTLLNLIQWRAVGVIRPVGLLICGGWALQQMFWWSEGLNSLVLTLCCDAIVLIWVWRDNWRDWPIALLTVGTMGFYIPAYFMGETYWGWWANWALVAFLMILGLPRGVPQSIGGSITHGSIKPEARKAGGSFYEGA